MAGYNGYSKSNNAVEAEAAGRYPITKAAKIVAQKTGVTIKEARRVLKELGTGGEWHHSSKFFNAVDYYDTAAAINYILYGDVESPEEKAEQARIEAEIKDQDARQAACSHVVEPVYRQVKGGGSVISHYRCTFCGKSPLCVELRSWQREYGACS